MSLQQATLRRDAIAPPALADLDDELSDRLFRCSATLGSLRPLTGEQVMNAPGDAFASLVHPLSPAYIELNGPAATPPRAADEAAALAWFEQAVAPIDPADPEGFATVLETLDRRLVGDAGGWRAGAIGTAADPRGNMILFPPAERIAGQLAPVRALLASDPMTTPAVFAAATMLALVTNCHPFRDGNGRVARILFNHVLRRGGMPADVYVPFSEFAARSDGGYLITLRQGEMRGNWPPYLSFAAALIETHHALAAGQQDDNHGR